MSMTNSLMKKKLKMKMKRPLEDIRPLIDSSSDATDISATQTESDDKLTDEQKAIVEQAENWYRNITKKEVKKKMMIEYINGITDDNVPRSKAVKMVEEAGL